MSEQQTQEQIQESVPVITSEEKPKEKDPKKVEAGKRLGAISKAAKEAKRQRLLREEEEQQQVSWKNYAIISIGFTVLGFTVYKYLTRQEKTPEPKKVHFEEESPKKPHRKVKGGEPISMFD